MKGHKNQVVGVESSPGLAASLSFTGLVVICLEAGTVWVWSLAGLTKDYKNGTQWHLTFRVRLKVIDHPMIPGCGVAASHCSLRASGISQGQVLHPLECDNNWDFNRQRILIYPPISFKIASQPDVYVSEWWECTDGPWKEFHGETIQRQPSPLSETLGHSPVAKLATKNGSWSA